MDGAVNAGLAEGAGGGLGGGGAGRSGGLVMGILVSFRGGRDGMGRGGERTMMAGGSATRCGAMCAQSR